jgi:hypothetical protein
MVFQALGMLRLEADVELSTVRKLLVADELSRPAKPSQGAVLEEASASFDPRLEPAGVNGRAS